MIVAIVRAGLQPFARFACCMFSSRPSPLCTYSYVGTEEVSVMMGVMAGGSDL